VIDRGSHHERHRLDAKLRKQRELGDAEVAVEGTGRSARLRECAEALGGGERNSACRQSLARLDGALLLRRIRSRRAASKQRAQRTSPSSVLRVC
jgi:hypothetical protein